MTNLGFSGAGPVISDSTTYSISVTAADANDFTAVATYLPTDNEANKCLTFEITGRGVRISDPEPDCWTRTR